MSTEMTLREFVEEHSQERVAAMMGVTQGAVSQMLRSERDIRVAEDGEQGYRFFEIKPVGKHRAA